MPIYVIAYYIIRVNQINRTTKNIRNSQKCIEKKDFEILFKIKNFKSCPIKTTYIFVSSLYTRPLSWQHCGCKDAYCLYLHICFNCIAVGFQLCVIVWLFNKFPHSHFQNKSYFRTTHFPLAGRTSMYICVHTGIIPRRGVGYRVPTYRRQRSVRRTWSSGEWYGRSPIKLYFCLFFFFMIFTNT